MEDTPRRRLERKSGSSSRSPSLSRRPSLKDKKVSGTIAKVKGKKSGASGSKKERWLLTRKTWRYMSDAVGNLLPESHRSSTSAAAASSSYGAAGYSAGPSGSGGSTRRTSSSGVVASEPGPSGSQPLASGFHVADIPGQASSPGGTSRPKSMPSAIAAGGSGSGQQSKASSTVTSPTYGGIMSFPSHRPGVTPTGPGPGKAVSPPGQSQQQHVLIATDKFYPPSDDIPTLEKHFEAVCNKEKRFLLWTRTKPKGLSGPALREAKMKQQKEAKGAKGGKAGHRDSSGSLFESLQLRFGGGSSAGNKENVGGDYYSPTTEEDDDYDEYDEDEITVRERRKSSTASSTMSMMGTGQCWTQGSLTVLRPLSTLSSHGSESSYSMIVTQHGVTKICRNTGTQTDPFPEELLIRFRLQAVQEERQQQELQRQVSPDNQSDATTVESPMSPVRLDTTQKVSSPPPTTTASPMSPTTSTDGVRSSGSGRESQEKLLETTAASSTRPSISGQSDSMATTKGGEGTSTSTTTTSATGDKKSEESGYSSSISDTVMKYLRIMRKNSKADNKDTIDKFKTVNYDRSLRYIKSKNVSVEEALEHEKNKEAMKNQKAQEAQQQALLASSASSTSESTPTTVQKTSKVSKEIVKSGGEPPSVLEKVDESSLEGSGILKTSAQEEEASPLRQAVSHDTPEPPPFREPSLPEQHALVNIAPTASPQSPPKTSRQQSEYDSDIPPSSPPPPPPLSPLSPKEARVFTLGSPPPPPVQQEMVSSSVGIQAGESLVRFLRNLNPNPLARKMSDFSSSCCSSESPVDMFSPRYSFATAPMSGSENEMFGGAAGVHQAAMASMMAMGAAKGGRRSQEGPGSLGPPPASAGATDIDALLEFDDVFLGMQPGFLQKPRQQGPASGEPLSSSWTSSGTSTATQTAIKKSSSVQQMTTFGTDLSGVVQATTSAPIATTASSSSYSLSQIFHYGSKSFRSRDRDKGGGSGGGGTSPDAASVPATPTTSSLGGSSGGLMKSFFGASPFSSTFGLKKSGMHKPTSTTSLTCTTNTGSDSISGRGLNVPPPTTSSSPNLLSLIQSSAASAGSGLTNLFSSSSRSGSSITSTGASRTGGGGGGGAAPAPSSTVSSSVMQKSKSSSSVLPLYGSSGSVSGAHGTSSSAAHLRASPSGSLGGDANERDQPCAGAAAVAAAAATPTSSAGGSGNRLISKTNKLFKSRSKSSTRGNTSSSGSAVCTWSPQGRCKWKSVSGKVVTLEPTTALSLSEIERVTLQEVALEKLRALNLGVDIKIPKADKCSGTQQKPKRRPYLLKKKALSTGFFESGKRDETKEASGGASGAVFGVALAQCVANDKLRSAKAGGAASLSADWEPQHTSQAHGAASHKRSQNGSRNSVTSVLDMLKDEKADPLVAPVVPSVPAIVTACINHLETYGLHTTGIFRVSTSLKRIRQLREDLDGGKDVQFGEDHSPHDVAALLKEFLRDLPEPLLSRELYQAFLKTQKIRNRKLQLEAIQHLVQLLPAANRDTLAALLKFFAKVVANSSETRSKTGELLPGNKMEGYSLATLIAPNILPCMPTEGVAVTGGSTMDQNAALTKERRESIDLVNYMISNFGSIFEVSSDLLHDVYLHLMDANPEAIEGLLRIKSGPSDEGVDELETTSSVFEESEGGELVDIDEPAMSSRVYRRREDILHEGAGKGGSGVSIEEMRNRERRQRREESGGIYSSAGGATPGSSSDTEKLVQSGGESDSSTGGKPARWFRRSRGDAKGRTSSDSGSEKVKGSRKRDSNLLETKRASSLDSVNVPPETLAPSIGAMSFAQAFRLSPRSSAVISGSGYQAGATSGGMLVAPAEMVSSRPLSGSDQSLRVPEHLMSTRRQSSPVLESSGIITASLKIPVPVPLNIDDTDIPYIEDENNVEYSGGGGAPISPYHHHHHHLVHHQQQSHYQTPPQYQSTQLPQQKYSQGQYPYPYHQMHMPSSHDVPSLIDPTNLAMVRCRSMSTDSSAPLKTTSSSVTTTPISSPARQPSSEISSPTGFSPPTSPPLFGTFPIEEMTARMLIGSAAASSSTPSTVTALSTSPSLHQFHHHSGAITMTTPSSVVASSSTVHQFPSISATSSSTTKDVMLESKSAGSTPITRPKIEKTLASGAGASGTSSSSYTPPTVRAAGSSPQQLVKGRSSGAQGAIASLAMVTTKLGDMGTKGSTSSSSQGLSGSSLTSSQSVPSQGPSSSQQQAAPSSSSSTSTSHLVPPVSTAQSSGASSPTPPASSGMMLSAAEPKGLGKETKGANIGGLIKSKTADFDKLHTTKSVSSSYMEPPFSETLDEGSSEATGLGGGSSEQSAGGDSSQPASISSSQHQIYSIAPKMRLRSQENVLLKQQFLLRQQQQHQQGESSTSRRERISLKGAEQTTQLTSAAEREQQQLQQQQDKAGTSQEETSSHSATPTGGSTGGGRSITRRRILGSASSSAIMSSGSGKSATGSSGGSGGRGGGGGTGTAPSQQRVRSREPDSASGSSSTSAGLLQPSPGQPQPSSTSTSAPPATSPSRWKRSEIIASRQQSQASPDPETFV